MLYLFGKDRANRFFSLGFYHTKTLIFCLLFHYIKFFGIIPSSAVEVNIERSAVLENDFSIEIVIDNEKIYGLYSDGNILVKEDKKALLIAKKELNDAMISIDNILDVIK